jgi:hypothetical protein
VIDERDEQILLDARLQSLPGLRPVRVPVGTWTVQSLKRASNVFIPHLELAEMGEDAIQCMVRDNALRLLAVP